MTDFSKISKNYKKKGVIQKSASDFLLGLLDIKEIDDVLDLGCGPGHLTKLIRKISNNLLTAGFHINMPFHVVMH